MGASPAKNLFEHEEQALTYAAYCIGFGKNHADKADSEIVKVCPAPLTPSKFQQVATQLSLNIKNHGVQTRIEEAVAKFSTVEELRVAAILLGQGSLPTKLELLYEVFAKGQIETAHLNALLRTVSKVCLDILGHLVGDGQGAKSGRLRNDHYISICKQAEERWLQSTKDNFTTPNTKDSFINVFSLKQELSSPQCFRRHCFAFAKANPLGARSKTSTTSAFSRLRAIANQGGEGDSKAPQPVKPEAVKTPTELPKEPISKAQVAPLKQEAPLMPSPPAPAKSEAPSKPHPQPTIPAQHQAPLAPPPIVPAKEAPPKPVPAVKPGVPQKSASTMSIFYKLRAGTAHPKPSGPHKRVEVPAPSQPAAPPKPKTMPGHSNASTMSAFYKLRLAKGAKP
jgi:hypothetical protein